MTTVPEQDRLLTPAEAAALARCHPSSLARWADAGRLPAVVRGRSHRTYPEPAVRALAVSLGTLPPDPEPALPTLPISDAALIALLAAATGVC